jgi:allantoate deiminase
VVAGAANLSLDLRHPQDEIRAQAHSAMLDESAAIARRRSVKYCLDRSESYAAVPADRRLTDVLAQAATSAGQPFARMVSGAGHDAGIMARLTPMTMLFVRSPGGVSHHPDEAVRKEDVAAALKVMVAFLQQLAREDAA